MFRRFIGGAKSKTDNSASNESLLLADLLRNGDPFEAGTKSASANAAQKYVTTDILGGGTPYGYMSNKSDIRANKYGAAFVVLKNVPAQRCVSVRASAVGGANWSIVTRKTNVRTGESEDETVATNTDYADNAIARAIVRYQQKYSEPLFARWEQALCIAGENYIELVTNRHYLPSDVEWLNPLFVDIDAPMNRINGYRYHGEGTFETFKPHQIAYDRIPDNLFTDVYGHSPLMTGVPDASVLINSGRALAAFFRNDARPGAIIRPKAEAGKNSWNETETKTIQTLVDTNHRGVDNGSRTLVLSLPFDLEVFDHPDLQKWAELIKTLETEIYTAFGVPRSIAGDSDSQRYQSSPQDLPNFKRLIKDELSRIQDSFNTSIVPFFDRGGRYRLEFDLSDFEVVPPETVAVAKDQLGAGIITLNESRQLLGLKELENGDVFYLPASSIVVPREQLAIIQSKPTYLPFGNPQGTIEQATEMAQSVGINTPNAPVPTQPAPNLTTEEIDPDAESAQDLQNPALPVDPTKEAGEPLFVGLSLANDPSLIGLQRRLMEVHPGSDVRWNTPADYHITVLYADVTDEQNARAFCEALKELPLPELSLRVGQVNSFDNLGEHAVHVRIRQNAALKEYQSAVYDLADEHGIICSPYSDPAQWTPHITLCYLLDKVGRTTFDSKLTVTPKGVNCDYGDTPLWRSWETDDPTPPEGTPPDDTEAAKDEFKAWLKYRDNNRNKTNARPFAFKHLSIPDGIQDLLIKGESKDAAFERLKPLLTPDIPDSIKTAILADDYDALPQYSDMYAMHLKDAFIPAHIAKAAVAKHYLRVLAAKAVQATRIDFEDGVEDLLKDALAGNVDRRRFGIILRNLIETAIRKAYMDGLSDGGISDPELDDSDIEWLEGWFDEQRAYVVNLADAIYKDGRVTPDEAQGKPPMWWNLSVQPAYAQAIASASKNAAFERVLGSTEAHCTDCVKINGQVRRASFWQKIGIWNASPKTECGGFKCECNNLPTDKPLTKGRFPQLVGYAA